MIFVDTSAWYARFATKDSQHDAVKAWHLANREALVTAEYVVDETLTLFKARGNAEFAFRIATRSGVSRTARAMW